MCYAYFKTFLKTYFIILETTVPFICLAKVWLHVSHVDIPQSMNLFAVFHGIVIHSAFIFFTASYFGWPTLSLRNLSKVFICVQPTFVIVCQYIATQTFVLAH